MNLFTNILGIYFWFADGPNAAGLVEAEEGGNDASSSGFAVGTTTIVATVCGIVCYCVNIQLIYLFINALRYTG